MASKNESYLARNAGLRMQWTGVLAGPLAWGLHMQVNYSLVPWVCAHGGEILIHLVTILALLITALGAFSAWRGLKDAGAAGAEAKANDSGQLPRARFMGILGLFTSAMFFLVIIAQEIPSYFFHPCQR